jgi:hypothetical protein
MFIRPWSVSSKLIPIHQQPVILWFNVTPTQKQIHQQTEEQVTKGHVTLRRVCCGAMHTMASRPTQLNCCGMQCQWTPLHEALQIPGPQTGTVTQHGLWAGISVLNRYTIWMYRGLEVMLHTVDLSFMLWPLCPLCTYDRVPGEPGWRCTQWQHFR